MDNPKSSKPEVLKEATIALGLKPLQFASLKSPEAAQALADSKAEIGVMAYVLQFVPQEFVQIPKFGMIQYHPSLLPRYRGPSAINWAIALGETKTGLTIFLRVISKTKSSCPYLSLSPINIIIQTLQR